MNIDLLVLSIQGTVTLSILLFFLVAHLKLSTHIQKLKKYGYIFSIIPALLVSVFLPLAWSHNSGSSFFGFFLSQYAQIVLLIFVIPVGLFYSYMVRVKPIPYLRGGKTMDSMVTDAIILVAAVSSFVIYTRTLVSSFSFTASELVRESTFTLWNEGDGTGRIVAHIYMAKAAFMEEVVYRLNIQNFLARMMGWKGNRYIFAIVVASIMWTFAHTGVLESNWLKYLQIFPMGVALGLVYERCGFEVAFLTHLLFNICALSMV